MSKFLDLIEENTPDLDLDEKIAAKRAVQRCLMEKDIRCDADQRSEDIMIHLPDGRVVKLEVKEFVNVEDQEMQVDGALDKQGNKAAALGIALKTAEDVTGAVDPKARMLGRSGVKQLAKAKNDAYLQIASGLKKAVKDIKRSF
jgi:hypothetical protein